MAGFGADQMKELFDLILLAVAASAFHLGKLDLIQLGSEWFHDETLEKT